MLWRKVSDLPASIYVHIPFCVRKCRYCDFYSVSYHEELVARYVKCLCAEIEERARDLQQAEAVRTLYLGGGTPSLLDPACVATIIDKIGSVFGILPEAEITLEVNPGTVNLKKMASYRHAGINRVSLGVQSFFDDILQWLGRLHSRQDVKTAFDVCLKAGFDNISIDLMYGVPGQDLSRWREGLDNALALNPQHVSAYLLQPEADTPLGRSVAAGEVELLSEEEELAQYELAVDVLTGAGYRHYELSNFARPGYECCHNLNYWQGGQYLGIGAGAVSFLKLNRYQNDPNVDAYIQSLSAATQPPRSVLECLNEEGIVRDRIVLGLRLMDGIDVEGLKRSYEVDFSLLFGSSVDRLIELGLIKRKGSKLCLSRKGYFLSNEVFREFL